MVKNIDRLFKKYPLTIKKPIEICTDEILIDKKYISYTGKTEEFEHGTYEICEIKAGTPMWGEVMPNGSVYIFQTENSHTCIKSDAKVGIDFEWNYSRNIPVNRKKPNNGI